MTAFLRLLDAAADQKGAVLDHALTAWRAGETPEGVFEVDPRSFEQVPGSPFAYWVSERIRRLFTELPAFEGAGRTVKQGLATADDFRFVRTWWEVDAAVPGRKWFPFAKGGAYSPFYADVPLVVNWGNEGREIRNNLNDRGQVRSNVWMLRSTASDFFFRPGLTWPLRTNGLSLRAVGSGGVFGHKGPMAFVASDSPEELLALNALAQSLPFLRLVELQLARTDLAQSFEVGLIASTPLPSLGLDGNREMARIARIAARARRRLDHVVQYSHSFLVPALLTVAGTAIRSRSERWAAFQDATAEEASTLQSQVNNIAFELYRIEGEDRRQMEEGFGSLTAGSDDDEDAGDAEDTEEAAEGVDQVSLVEALLEWTLGVALGRFDVRLATGERPSPPDPEPFDPLPVCSPGMLQDDDGLPATSGPAGYPLDLPPDGILVDDPGHPWDVVARMEAVLDLVAGAQAHQWIQEAEAILSLDLRSWLRRQAFERHLKRYSRSRRKAPIFWHLAPKSREYGVWLYSPVATRDTMYRILNDYVDPRRKGAERRLIELRQESGDRPTAQQRRELAAQESLVTELRAFREELARVAPLWAPFRDDGVVLNCTVLWRLFDHHRAWQKECKAKWGELAKGKYDWAGWAMHLWPDRVVRACAADRSIAMAHGLEDALWAEGEDGNWAPREDVGDQLVRLTAERRSPALEAALDEFVRSE